jgi:hypothetical protein
MDRSRAFRAIADQNPLVEATGLAQCISLLPNFVVYFSSRHKHWMDHSNARVLLEGFT